MSVFLVYYIYLRNQLYLVHCLPPKNLAQNLHILSNWIKLILKTTDHSCPFGLVAPSCLTLCNPMDCSTPGLPVHHQLLEFTQTHVHWVSDAFQLSHPLSPPPPPAFNLSQPQGLFKWVSSLHQVAKVLEFPLQHQSFQRILRTDLL